MKKKILSCIMAVTMFLLVSAVAYAKTDDELRASNEIEFFVTESDGSWWNVTYSANSPVGNKYWYEVVEGVQRSGIRIDKVSEFRYQLVPETQEQINLLCGYKTADDEYFGATGIRQVHKLQAFLRDVESPSANERIAQEKKQAVFDTESKKLKEDSTGRWASIITSYLYDNGDNTFNVIDYSNKEFTVSTYSNSDYALLNTTTVPFELEIFGGFYSGEKYNYIVFGQNNSEESDSKEVIRIVKYDKNFNRLAQTSVNNCYTTEPLHHSLRMCEKKNKLFVHTARTRYLTDDGLHHQSQLTIILDTDKMAVENSLGAFQGNHVSHSFNQFVIYDGDTFVLADHGDAYPRSIVLNKYNGKPHEVTETSTEQTENGSVTYTTTYTTPEYASIDLFEIPGKVGANCTGVTIGGFEYSDNNYLVAINTIDHSKVSEYTSYKMEGLDKDERNIVLLVSGKNNTDTSKVKKVYLTDYINKNKLGSTPYLVKLSDDRFLILWEEFEYTNNYNCVDNGVKYVQVNGNGEIISDIRLRADLQLSSDCQPVLIDNNLTWYINGLDERKFYTLDLNSALITVNVNGQLINFDQPPIIIDGRTLVPLRAIFEALGATVEWNSDTQNVTSKKGSTSVSLSIDSNTMYKNGKAVTLDVPAQLINDRTLVPARAVAEAFGCDVNWDSDNKTVTITN